MDTTVSKTVVVIVWTTLRVTNILDIVTGDVTLDIPTMTVAIVNLQFQRYTLC